MRQGVYVKFAEAIRTGRAVKAASARRTLVRVKFAAAVALRHVNQYGQKAITFLGRNLGAAYKGLTA